MDNIAQSMRFSPTHGIICGKRKPKLACGKIQRKLKANRVGQMAFRDKE